MKFSELKGGSKFIRVFELISNRAVLCIKISHDKPYLIQMPYSGGYLKEQIKINAIIGSCGLIHIDDNEKVIEVYE